MGLNISKGKCRFAHITHGKAAVKNVTIVLPVAKMGSGGKVRFDEKELKNDWEGFIFVGRVAYVC